MIAAAVLLCRGPQKSHDASSSDGEKQNAECDQAVAKLLSSFGIGWEFLTTSGTE